jgi:hypothetical protein
MLGQIMPRQIETRRTATPWTPSSARRLWSIGQPGLWFLGGGLAQCRIFSKVLALQIKARELGVAPKGS